MMGFHHPDDGDGAHPSPANPKDGDLGLIYVNASNGLARAQGVRPGALLSNVGHRGGLLGRPVSGWRMADFCYTDF